MYNSNTLYISVEHSHMDGMNHVYDVSRLTYGLCLFTINFMMVFNAYMMHINAYYTLFLLVHWFMKILVCIWLNDSIPYVCF